jgi:hypothetical protein
MTSAELWESAPYGAIHFPEMDWHTYGVPIPLTEDEQLGLCSHLKGKTFVTTSEIIILSFLRKIRLGDMRTDELELYCAGRRIAIGVDGSLIDPWDGGFFETGFNLLFH